MKKSFARKMAAVVVSALLALQLVPMQAVAAEQPSQNMLKNGSFEEGNTHWVGARENQIDTTEAHTGKNSLHVVMETAWEHRVTQEVKNVLPGKCTVSGYLNGVGNHAGMNYGAALIIEVQDAHGKYLKSASTYTVVSTNGWEEHSATVDVPEEGASVTVVISVTKSIFPSNSSDFYIDDVTLTGNFSPVPPDSENLLQNAGFESGLANWAQRGDNSCAFSTDAQARSGKQSVYMGYFISEPLVNYIEQTCPVGKAGVYEFSAHIKTDATLAGVGATLFIEAKNSAGAVIASANSAGVSNSEGAWKKVSVRLTVPATAQTVTVKLGGVYSTGAFYADDLSLVRDVSL